jgi:hypothetical protein
MVEVPTPTMVILFPEIVATAVFELVYVIKPSLLVVGGIMLKDASPNDFIPTEKLVRTVVALFTVRVAVIVAAKKLVVVA